MHMRPDRGPGVASLALADAPALVLEAVALAGTARLDRVVHVRHALAIRRQRFRTVFFAACRHRAAQLDPAFLNRELDVARVHIRIGREPMMDVFCDAVV